MKRGKHIIYRGKCYECKKYFESERHLFPSGRVFCSVKCRAVNKEYRLCNSKVHQKGKILRNGYIFSCDSSIQNRQDRRKGEHRFIIEKLIGRKLLTKEIVHHCDGNKTNNNPSNLLVLKHNTAHQRLHGFARKHKIPIVVLKFEQSWLYS